jgi:hypothetical protein
LIVSAASEYLFYNIFNQCFQLLTFRKMCLCAIFSFLAPLS